jgi:hypothetical protein
MARTDRVIVSNDRPDQYAGARYDGTPVRRTSWGSVFAGALIALMVTLLLTLLFTGIGLQSFSPATSADPAAGLGTGSIIAVIVTNLLALFLGGYVAGRLAGSPRRGDGVLHGLLTWGVLTLFTLYFLTTTIGGLIGGAANLLGSTVAGLAQGAAAVAPAATDAAQEQGVDANFIQQQVNQLLADAGVQNPQRTGQELVQRITQRVQAGENPVSPEALDEYTTFLANNSDLTEEEIEQQVQAFQQQLAQTQQQVAQTVEEATDVAGTTLIWAFVGLLLGAVVAVLGAVAGSPKDPAEAHAA